jgi:cation diffusion facilitator CzcD-associated flavoprotein CzcO
MEIKPDWSRTYATGAEILGYVQEVAERNDLLRSICFDAHVKSLRWRGDQWAIELHDGRRFAAEFVVSATGGLHTPNIPGFAGLESFAGQMFHTARWNHAHDLAGRSVALIGTGASAVQCAPVLAQQAARLFVFQRSPVWVLPKRDLPYSVERKRRFARSRLLARWHRFKLWSAYERFGVEAVRDTPRNRELTELAVRTIRRKVRDPVLADRLIPRYPYGCKRPTLSNDYYETFNRPNVTLVTEPIERVEPSGIRTRSSVHAVDTIVFATGFRPFDITQQLTIEGREGVGLQEAWRDRIMAYRTVMVPGFPNLFLMLGPNSGGLTSALQMIEVQADFMLRCLRVMRRRGLRRIEPDRSATERWNERLQQDIAGTLMNAACHSWWTDDRGYNHTTYPHSSWRFRRELARIRRRELLME